MLVSGSVVSIAGGSRGVSNMMLPKPKHLSFPRSWVQGLILPEMPATKPLQRCGRWRGNKSLEIEKVDSRCLCLLKLALVTDFVEIMICSCSLLEELFFKVR